MKQNKRISLVKNLSNSFRTKTTQCMMVVFFSTENRWLKQTEEKSYQVVGSFQMAYLLAEPSLTSVGQNFSRRHKTCFHAQELISYLFKCCCKNQAAIVWSFSQTAYKFNSDCALRKRSGLALGLAAQSHISEKKKPL